MKTVELRSADCQSAVSRVSYPHPPGATHGAALRLLTSGLVGLWLVGCSRSPAPAPTALPTNAAARSQVLASPWFEEVALSAGVDFTYHTGHEGRYYMPEIKGGGGGLLDFDGDGLLDLFCVQAGSLHPEVTHRPTHKLFHNLGGWKFADVTEKAGVAGIGRFGMGCACGDFNNDGRPDIFITHVGANLLYRNNGDGTFTDVTQSAGVAATTWGVSAAFFDYDGDGWLDLVVANYLRWSPEVETDCFSRGGLPDYCSPLSYKAPAMATLFHNRGDGTFENVTVAAGLDKAYGNGLGVVCADFNRDGKPDIFVANDASPNQLWINQGGGRFVDEAMIRGCAVNALGMSEAGMGITTADLNQDGWRDLFVTHLVGEANRLFMNTNGYFTDVVRPAGPGVSSWPNTSFGVGFYDFDHDGELDLYVSNGRVKRGVTDLDPADVYAEQNTLLRGLGGGAFAEVPNAGTARPLLAAGRGAAFGDLDNDGDIDVVVFNRDRPLFLLKNVAPKKGHWIGFRLLNQKGLEAVGAETRLETGGRVWWRAVSPHESYASSNDPRVHCGLGPATQVQHVTVLWPDGKTEGFGPFPADAYHTVREGTGQTLPPFKFR